jgi:hypothetical protein
VRSAAAHEAAAIVQCRDQSGTGQQQTPFAAAAQPKRAGASDSEFAPAPALAAAGASGTAVAARAAAKSGLERPRAGRKDGAAGWDPIAWAAEGAGVVDVAAAYCAVGYCAACVLADAARAKRHGPARTKCPVAASAGTAAGQGPCRDARMHSRQALRTCELTARIAPRRHTRWAGDLQALAWLDGGGVTDFTLDTRGNAGRLSGPLGQETFRLVRGCSSMFEYIAI